MEENFEELKILADKSYHLCCILKEYCKIHYYDIEEMSHMYTLIEYLLDNIDTLNSIFINISLPDENADIYEMVPPVY